MAKQIYIDENGNENLVSGTINTGKLLPMSPSDPDKVADRIEACETEISTSNISAFVSVNNITFTSGTTTEQCIANLISTYGKKAIIFGYILTGVGWFTGMITFHSDNQGGGFLVAMGNGKLWSVTYVNGTITIFEK